LTPNDALEKVAIEYGFGPDFIDRVGQLYNTSCTLRQLADTKGHLKRAIEHPLADPGEVVERLFSQTSEKKSAGVDNLVKASLYEDPMSISAGSLVKAAEERSSQEYSRDPSLLLKSAFKRVDAARKDVTALDSRVFQMQQHRDLLIQKAAAHFRQDGCERFGEVENRIKSAYGKVGECVMDTLWEMLGGAKKLHKRASAEPTRALLVPGQSPYRELSDVIKLSVDLNLARRQKAAAAGAVEEVRQGIFKRASQLTSEEEPIEKEATITSALQFKGVSDLLDSLTDESEAESAKQKATIDSIDPEHDARMRAIRAQSVFSRLVAEDPVISQYDPAETAEAYNEISTLAPHIANQPAVLRGYLRRFLESSPQSSGRLLDTFEAGQLKDMDLRLSPNMKALRSSATA
jgi:hypothetical protein